MPNGPEGMAYVWDIQTHKVLMACLTNDEAIRLQNQLRKEFDTV